MIERERFDLWWAPGKKAIATATDGFYKYDVDLREVGWEAWQAARRWIPVSEKPPESETLVLFYSVDNQMFYLGYYINKHLEDLYGREFSATHWQPLPEPPKE